MSPPGLRTFVRPSLDPHPHPPANGKPRLMDRVREAIRARHYSPRTEDAYVAWIKRFIFFHNKRHPAEMAEPEINAFLTHLAVKEKVSASTQNQALSALLFLYRHIIGREVGDLGEVVRARKPKRIPAVMTRDETKVVLAHLTGDKWLMASLMYGAGLRLMECLGLRAQGTDFGRSESRSPVLAGMGDIKARPEIGGFFNFYLSRDFNLTSTLRYGSGNDRRGAQIDLGAVYAVQLAPQWRTSFGVSTTIAPPGSTSSCRWRVV